ncbi:MAG TPA: ribose-phosphate pyrophosphokinase [Tissierellaceae bacterium]|nr:ribose-phosphate pyrophosphokinase [Tissierellaceae bacterium]
MSSIKKKIKLISGNANEDFSEKIAKELDADLIQCDVTHFSDGEINVNISETVRGMDVYIIQPTCSPVNDNLMELLILIDAVKRASAGRINAVIPYYGYARQDRKAKAREPITAKLVAELLTVAGAQRVATMDLHAGQIQGFFDIPVDHLTAIPTMVEHFKDIVTQDTVVVSPDLGGVTRVRNFANLLDLPIAMIEKRRPDANVSEVMNVIGDIEDKNVILVDDIIDTAGTICKASSVLKKFGAKKVYGCATHGVLSGPAIKRINESALEKFIITDTIPFERKSEKEKIEVISVAPIFAETIRRINGNRSISVLFD